MQDTNGEKKRENYTYVLRLTDRRKKKNRDVHTITKITNSKILTIEYGFFFL
jgi:hypothetical protein